MPPSYPEWEPEGDGGWVDECVVEAHDKQEEGEVEERQEEVVRGGEEVVQKWGDGE